MQIVGPITARSDRGGGGGAGLVTLGSGSGTGAGGDASFSLFFHTVALLQSVLVQGWWANLGSVAIWRSQADEPAGSTIQALGAGSVFLTYASFAPYNVVVARYLTTRQKEIVPGQFFVGYETTWESHQTEVPYQTPKKP